MEQFFENLIREVSNINSFYLACLSGVFIGTKAITVQYIIRLVVLRKNRMILICLALLVTPIGFTLTWLLHLDVMYLFLSALASPWIEIALINWYRVIFEPIDALDDIEYDNSITNV
jgi:hypothetical protein